MSDLDAMLAFARVVDHGGISAAAAAMALPKSNISRRLNALEARLGVRLLERTTRKIHLTEIGRLYYQHCRRIAQEIEHADSTIANAKETPQGTLRVSASVATGQHLIGPLLAGFIKRYPDVTVSLQLSNRRVDLIEEGFDLAIRIGPLESSSLISRRLGRGELGVYTTANYIRHKTRPERPLHLTGLDCVAMAQDDGSVVWTMTGPEDTVPVKIVPRVVVNDFGVIRQLLLDGVGIALLPHHVVRSAPSSNRFIRLLPDWSVQFVELHAVYPSHRGATPKMRAFLDWLSANLTLE